jgi:hypothetical protein
MIEICIEGSSFSKVASCGLKSLIAGMGMHLYFHLPSTPSDYH